MRISGVATMHAPADQVWTALNDPRVLVATIPGCDRLEPTGPDSYRLTVTAGVASIQGTYTGDISLSEQRQPSSFLLTANGAGGPGTVSTSVRVSLASTADGCTELTYDADAVIGGMIGGVGQRMLSGVAKRLAGEFFTAIDGALARGGAPPEHSLSPAGSIASAAAPVPAAYVAPVRPAAAVRDQGFSRGVLVGAAIALAGVAVGSLLGRRAR
jgi:uncharacterized protein